MAAQQLSREDARAIARIFYAANQRHAAQLAAEQTKEQADRAEVRGDVDA